MDSSDISETIEGLREEVVYELVAQHIPPQSLIEQWDIGGLEQALQSEFGSAQSLKQLLEQDQELDEDRLAARVLVQIEEEYAAKEGRWRDNGIDMRTVEKQIMLQILDQRWKEHLAAMDQLRQGIHLRAYAQKQPKQEFKRESFELFQDLLQNIKFDVIRMLSRMQIENPEEIEAQERLRRAEAAQKMNFQHSQLEGSGDQSEDGSSPQNKAETFVREERKVGRNEPCPCGSGKKYKQCHGRI